MGGVRCHRQPALRDFGPAIEAAQQNCRRGARPDRAKAAENTRGHRVAADRKPNRKAVVAGAITSARWRAQPNCDRVRM